MKLSEFNYELPAELIAEYPTEERDESRLMVINKNEGTIEHKEFKDIFATKSEENMRFEFQYRGGTAQQLTHPKFQKSRKL